MIKRKQQRLSLELLGITAVCAAVSFALSWMLRMLATVISESYYFNKGTELAEAELEALDLRIFQLSLIFSVAVFVVMFLVVIGDRLSYIRTIAKGISDFGEGRAADIPLEGNNELTFLADSINEISRKSLEVRARERELSEEKEQFIRTLSHDIRTPLTSVIAYTDILSKKKGIAEAEMADYIALVKKNSERIRDISNILIGTGERHVERFENAALLFCQLADEFEDSLQDFTVNADISELSSFAGAFDVLEMRRVFDNLISNIEKYADREEPVRLFIKYGGEAVTILQENKKGEKAEGHESYKMGINSIRRIARSYGGAVEVTESADRFSIKIILSNF